jgi:hypothetical protein
MPVRSAFARNLDANSFPVIEQPRRDFEIAAPEAAEEVDHDRLEDSASASSR